MYSISAEERGQHQASKLDGAEEKDEYRAKNPNLRNGNGNGNGQMTTGSLTDIRPVCDNPNPSQRFPSETMETKGDVRKTRR